MMLTVAPVRTPIPTAPPERFILLVDDHEPSLRGLRQVVESAGYACVAFPTSPEALSFGLAKRPTLVVTDLVMPDLDGRGLARRFKSRDPSLPILLLTGEMLDDPALSALKQTFDAVFTKPLQVESFLRRISDLMPPPKA